MEEIQKILDEKCQEGDLWFYLVRNQEGKELLSGQLRARTGGLAVDAVNDWVEKNQKEAYRISIYRTEEDRQDKKKPIVDSLTTFH